MVWIDLVLYLYKMKAIYSTMQYICNLFELYALFTIIASYLKGKMNNLSPCGDISYIVTMSMSCIELLNHIISFKTIQMHWIKWLIIIIIIISYVPSSGTWTLYFKLLILRSKLSCSRILRPVVLVTWLPSIPCTDRLTVHHGTINKRGKEFIKCQII